MALAAFSLLPAKTTAHSNTVRNAASNSSPYTLVADYPGATFFNHFTAFSDADPTNGHVNYTTMPYASSIETLALLYNEATGETTAYMGVDHQNQAPDGRNSVRISSRQSFKSGMLAVMDLRHVPAGDGTWPAAWFLGTGGKWPEVGESDWLEWVHQPTGNGMTLHTSPGCSVDNNSVSTSATGDEGMVFMGKLEHSDCNHLDGYVGCGIWAESDESGLATAGAGLNAQGGAVYVHEWTDEGFTTWMFPHDQVPEDLLDANASPDPRNWQRKPLARHTGSGCDFEQRFNDMVFILDTTFCGDWAGADAIWEGSGARERTGAASCEEWVSEHPEAFAEAYWEIAGLRIWSSGEAPGLVETSPSGDGKEKRQDEGAEFKVFAREEFVGWRDVMPEVVVVEASRAREHESRTDGGQSLSRFSIPVKAMLTLHPWLRSSTSPLAFCQVQTVPA
ncbi:hypothetical protein MBLNU230_g1398t1 [Neophaeotheca triangularis]